jgi:hypothetical protein
MFIQIIRGKVADAAAFEAAAERWPAELKPGAVGYLGCTWGLSPDGVGLVAARFDSAESANANAARPEQGEWWQAMEPAFAEVSFQDCAEVDALLGGGSDDAGFVQVIQGQVKDQAAAREVLRGAEEQLHQARPDILGGVMGWHGDGGGFTQIMYFRSESEARAAESSGMDPEVQAAYEGMMAAEPTFTDLPDPKFD